MLYNYEDTRIQFVAKYDEYIANPFMQELEKNCDGLDICTLPWADEWVEVIMFFDKDVFLEEYDTFDFEEFDTFGELWYPEDYM